MCPGIAWMGLGSLTLVVIRTIVNFNIYPVLKKNLSSTPPPPPFATVPSREKILKKALANSFPST